MLVLHVGTQKTGSSSVQHFLRENQSELNKKNINFVSAVRDWIDHNKLARELRGGGAEHPRLDAVLAEVEENPEQMQIVSAEELFHSRVPEKLKELLPQKIKNDAKVVVYLRRPDNLMEALYKQRLKTGAIKPGPEKYLEENIWECNYLRVLDAFADCFGREAIVVRPYSRGLLKDGDVVADFSEVLGIDLGENVIRSKPEDNPTFSAAVSELMGFCVRNSEVRFASINERIAKLGWDNLKRSGDVYSLEQRFDLMMRLKDDLDEVVERYCPLLKEVFSFDDLKDEHETQYPSADESANLYRQAGRAVVFSLRDFLKKK